jgi:Uma2 family endonuclease
LSISKKTWLKHTLLIYSLEEGKYKPSRLFTHDDVVNSKCIPGFELDLEEVFGNLEEVFGNLD